MRLGPDGCARPGVAGVESIVSADHQIVGERDVGNVELFLTGGLGRPATSLPNGARTLELDLILAAPPTTDDCRVDIAGGVG